MNEIERLVKAYEQIVGLPWEQNLAWRERVWFAIHDPPQERRLRLRISKFQIATKNAGHSWTFLDITDSFAHWMACHEYRDAYFESPDSYGPLALLEDYASHVSEQIIAALAAPSVNDNTVVAVSGLASLFGLTRAADILERTVSKSRVRGRLLVFFPGTCEKGNYLLLDARDGWNYLAIPIHGKDME